jgi:hypothetical protein
MGTMKRWGPTGVLLMWREAWTRAWVASTPKPPIHHFVDCLIKYYLRGVDSESRGIDFEFIG